MINKDGAYYELVRQIAMVRHNGTMSKDYFERIIDTVLSNEALLMNALKHTCEEKVRLHPGMVPMKIEECFQRIMDEQYSQRKRLDALEVRAGIIQPPLPEP